MVEVVYRNRLGNKLFQYCFGRILAELMGWELRCPPIPEFPGTAAPLLGKSYSGPICEYNDGNMICPQTIARDRTPRKLLLRGWFQRYKYYQDFAAKIRTWLVPRPSLGAFPTVGDKDLLVHARLGADYESKRWILHPSFYDEILDNARDVQKLYVCYDAREKVSPEIRQHCLAPLMQRGAILFTGDSPLDDFNFALKFRRIAISASTFTWWAAYLSKADAIFFPDLKSSRYSCWREEAAGMQSNRLEVGEERYHLSSARTLWD